MTTAMTVNFHGNALYGKRIGNTVYVALKPIVEAMGLQWSAQLKRIKRNKIFSRGMSIMDIPSPGGAQPTIALRLDLLPGWLVGIEAARIRVASIRDKIILFQSECYEVLAAHFLGRTGGVSERFKQDNLSVRMAREARLLFGQRAGAEVWLTRGLPQTPSMKNRPYQPDFFKD